MVGILKAALFPAVVVSIGVALLISHWRRWRRLDPADHSPEQAFCRRRLRRRCQTSAMVTLIGVALLGGQFIPAMQRPALFVWFWAAVLALVVWVVLLALADMFDSRREFGRLKDQRMIEAARLQVELRRAKQALAESGPPGESNGDSPANDGA